LRRVKLKPGRKLTVHCDAWVRAGGTEIKRPVVVVWDGGDGRTACDPRTATLEAQAVADGLAAPFRGLFARLPPWNASVQVFPLDARFPQLVRLSDPWHVAAMLASCLPQASGVSYRVSTIRYRPGERHVLRYEPAPGQRGPVVFAKLSRREADIARAFRVYTRVADRMDVFRGGIRVVRPFGALADDGVILFPAVSGRPLSTLLRLRDHGVSGHLEQAARALRVLHSSPAALAEAMAARDFAADIEGARRASEHICALLPRTGAAITETLERARAVHDRLPREAPTFIHGDFKADHLWVSHGGLTLIDFGSCGIGDPARDVGKFLADLRWWSAVSGRGSASARAAFRAAYGTEGSEARLLRARVYEALFLLVFAAHRVPLYHPDWAQRTARLAQRARAVLDALD